MKIIHTSDWHLGQDFYRYDRADEHRHFFDQLASIAADEHADALVVSGDIFHNAAPSNPARRLFIDGVLQVHAAAPDTIIIITAGNHDSGSRLDAERALWHRVGIHVVGGCRRNAEGTFDPAQFIVGIPGKGTVIAAPFFHSTNYPPATPDTPRDDRQRAFYTSLIAGADSDLPIVMTAHLAVEGCNTRGHEDEPIGGMFKDDLTQLGEGYDYLALGHIHKPQCINPRVYYSGSPVAVSFSEDYPHYVNVVEIDRRGDIPRVRQVEIDQLRHVLTLPPDGAPLDAALDSLRALDDNDNSYVRLLIDQDELIAADAEDRARVIAGDKACRYCEIRRKPRNDRRQTSDDIHVEDIDDIERLDPIDIARRSFLQINDVEMTENLIDLMRQAIALAQTSED